jgi:hypothetical protein
MRQLPKCEVCGGEVYRRLAKGSDGKGDWVGELWHLDNSFLEVEDFGHYPTMAEVPERIPLMGD